MTEHYRRQAPLDQILAQVEDASPEGLAVLDQFHTGGIASSRDLAALAGITAGEAVLDVGAGAGGPARLLTAERRARVTGVDLTATYVELARALSARSGIEVDFRQANALELPFAAGGFDVVWTQHTAMNIADRPRLYGEIRRVLKPGGRLALHDIFAGPKGGPLHLPVPWADAADESFLVAPEALRRLLHDLGFTELAWQDRTQITIASFDATPARKPLIHLLLGQGFLEMRDNMRRNFTEGRVAAAMGVFRRGTR
jgi:ubiquinone/menaquinone biosynthesis C-methylase UbiE